MRPYPSLGAIGSGAATSPAGRWSRTSSAWSSTTTPAASSRPRRTPTRPPRRTPLGMLGATAAARRDRLARRRGDLRPLHRSTRGRGCIAGRLEDFRSRPTARPAPLRPPVPARQPDHRPGRPLHAADRPRGRPAPGAAARRRRLPVGHRRARRRPRPATASRSTWVIKLGPRMQRRADLRARQLRDHAPRRSWSRSRSSRATTSTTTAVERSQRNLGFLQLFNNAHADLASRARTRSGDVVPMVVEVEERYEQYSVIHVGRRRLDRSEAARLVAARSASTCAPATTNRDLLGHGWTLTSNARPTARRCCAATCRSSTGASSARCSASTPRSPTCSRRRCGSATSTRAAARSASRARCTRASTPAFTTTCATPRTPSRCCAQAGPDETAEHDPAGHHRRQPLGQRRVAAHGQPPAADARLPHRRDRRAGAARAVGAAAAVPASPSATTRS